MSLTHGRNAWLAVLLLFLPGCSDKVATPTTSVPPPAVPQATTPAAANRAPSARISDYQPRTTAVAGGTHVSFGASASDPDGDRLSFSWDFGDGTSGNGEALFHVFFASGSFDVKLTVTDGRGGVATDTVRVTARRIEGEWQVNNAAHVNLTARLSQGNGSSVFWGVVSDGSLIEGRLLDPYGIVLTYSSTTGLCIPSGTYEGNVYTSVNTIVFDGPACRGFSLLR
jgi:PKD domain-containing protein